MYVCLFLHVWIVICCRYCRQILRTFIALWHHIILLLRSLQMCILRVLQYIYILDTCHMSISIVSLRDKVTLYFNIADVAEWSWALDIRLSDWCCSVSMVWVQIPSREEQKVVSSKILTLFGLMFRRIYIYMCVLGLIFRRIYIRLKIKPNSVRIFGLYVYIYIEI